MDNLISNAIEFTPEGGEITVTARRIDGVLRCEGADTGPGIESEAQGRLFERFGQLDASPTWREGGLGLGLSISRALVEGHGGRIGVVSTPGRGSVLWFDIPQGAASDSASRHPISGPRQGL